MTASTSKMSFAGKWSFFATGNNYINLEDPKNGDINIKKTSSPGADQYFNAYGDPTTGLLLQAGNLKYLSFSTNTYSANQARGGSPAKFVLENVSGSQFRIIEKAAGGKEYYLNVTGTILGRIAKSGSPPATTEFTQTIVTYGLKSIQQLGAPGLNLTGVYLSGENLGNVNFLSCDLSNADLSGRSTNFKNAVFQGSTINSTDFSNCNLEGVGLAPVTGTSPIFNGIQMNKATNFDGSTINKAQFKNATNPSEEANPGVSNGVSMNNITASEAVFNGSNLGGATFSGGTLTKAQLINVNLSYAQAVDTHFDNAVMSSVLFNNASAQNSFFNGAILANATFDQAVINGCDFTSAQMINAKLSKANGYTRINLTATNLTGAVMTGMDLTSTTITTKTNFTKAQMDSVNLDGFTLDGNTFLAASLKQAILTNTSFNNAILVGADMSNAIFKKTGSKNITFYGANLSNAKLLGVNLTGSQFGATKSMGNIAHTAIRDLDNARLPKALFSKMETKQSKAASKPKVTVREPGQHWMVEDNDQAFFITKNENDLSVEQAAAPETAAVLTNVFMQNAKLTGANLFAVDMSGVSWYGTGKADNANLEQVNLSNANLSTLNLTQAKMYGANLSFANLVGTNFTKVKLSPTSQAKPASLAFTSLQNAIFTQAKLDSADLTNAAVSLDISGPKGEIYGVPLFKVTSNLTSIIPSLNGLVISDDLVTAFTNNFPITAKNCLAILSDGKWIIKATAGGNYQQYILVYDNQKPDIQVYGEVPSNSTKAGKTKISLSAFVAVPIFQIELTKTKKIITSLDQAKTSDISTVFKNAGYSLVKNACVTIVQSGNRWVVNNKSSDKNALQSGYGQFDLVTKTLGGAIEYIQVYGGSPLLVTRTETGNVLIPAAVEFGPTTVFTNTIMSSTTTCPSGLKFGLLASKAATYEELMTPGLPPHPGCVPSLTHFCPHKN